MTLDQAKQLKRGDYIHHQTRTNTDGTPMRAKVTSVKTWKTRPWAVEIRYKRGMKEFGTLNENEIQDFNPGYGS